MAGEFFSYLGRHLPQHCASDEFYFLPRSEAATEHLAVLDELTPGKVQEHIRHVKHLLREIASERPVALEAQIDRLFLMQSMQSFIREFEDAKVWQRDPTLYVKIPLFATDQVISRRDDPSDQLRRKLSSLFEQIPSFLGVAVQNLRDLSEISLGVACAMAQDAIHFFSRDIPAFIEERLGGDEGLVSKNRAVVEAWERYRRRLLEKPAVAPPAVGESGLQKIISLSLGYPRSPQEIVEVAKEAYEKTGEKMRALAAKIDSRKSWHRIIYERLPSAMSPEELMQLYVKEVEGLRRFFYTRDVITFPPEEKVTVVETPSYLRSLRATASYRAPLTGRKGGNGIFYVTPGKEDLGLISSHCPYLSAHETYPGHHILDHLRIHHPNPVRRQIESPLFYEGWACYAEQLLDELGYIQDLRQQLVQLKRQLWRCLRAVLDVELQTGKVSLSQGAEKIRALGFSSKRAQRQIRRFYLSPGYQLCYFMGAYEILQLRKQFSSQIGLKTFHDTLLGGGQIPFHLVEKRLKAFTVTQQGNQGSSEG
ncbi:MAG: DUF885 family protein [Desulfobacteraceae bacterium]